MPKINFSCDYTEGAIPEILERLQKTNLMQTPGYGMDPVCEEAKGKIRRACQAPQSEVYFLVGGTQTNAVVIDSILHRYEGVVAAETGHVAVHEAGAIEFCGHKVLTVPGQRDKISSQALSSYLDTFLSDATHEHMVQPGMVYISQPTEYGSLYSRQELEELHAVCRRFHLPLYVDGARLAYALAAPGNDVTLPVLAQSCEAFYIGGTKCGALLGEAVVFCKPDLVSHFFTSIKQHGALLAKGRLLGIQFDVLFTDDRYYQAGEHGIEKAGQIRECLTRNGYSFGVVNTTNQIFVLMTQAQYDRISETVVLDNWGKTDEDHLLVRIATSWATTEENTQTLCRLLEENRNILHQACC